MATIKIRALEDGGSGPLLGPFTIEAGEGHGGLVAASVVSFNRWVAGGMTFYQSKGGIENSSLFKSYAMECFEELASEDPEAAARLTDLVVVCSGLPASLQADLMWQLHRAILASLPGVRFIE